MGKIRDMTATPEHDKLEAVADISQQCGEVLEWLLSRYSFCTRHIHTERCPRDEEGLTTCGFRDGELVAMPINVEKELAEFFGIDLKKIEAEKKVILDGIREQPRTTSPAVCEHGKKH